MKLLLVTPYYHPKIGGLENYVYHLVERLLQDETIQIIIVTSNHEDNTYDEKVIHKRYKIYRLPTQFKLSNTPINLNWYRDIKKIISQEKPDIINAHAPVPYIADIAALAAGNIPFVVTYHAGSMLKNKPLLDLVIGLYEGFFLRKLFNRANRIICYSSEFIQNYLSPYTSKVTYIPPGVDTNLFKPAAKTKKEQSVLYVGKLEKSAEWKGVKVLLEAIKILQKEFPAIQLSLVGEGDAVQEYKEQTKFLGIEKNVTFAGIKKGQDLVKQYQDATVFVLPSTTNAESFGIVLIEAMACGLPVIGSRIGGIPGVIDHNANGLLVKPKDSAALAHAIKKILLDKNLAHTLGKNGRAMVEKKFTWDSNVEKFKQIIYELV